MSCGAKHDEEKHSRENLYKIVSEGVPEVTEESHSGKRAACVSAATLAAQADPWRNNHHQN